MRTLGHLTFWLNAWTQAADRSCREPNRPRSVLRYAFRIGIARRHLRNFDTLYQDPVCPSRTFRFNDHICVEGLHGVPIEKRTGRLIQVRVGIGVFNSDLYLVRLRDHTLAAFENVMIRGVDDERFTRAYYELGQGIEPPQIPPQATCPDDTPQVEYSQGTGRRKRKATGFIIRDMKRRRSEPDPVIALTIQTGIKP